MYTREADKYKEDAAAQGRVYVGLRCDTFCWK